MMFRVIAPLVIARGAFGRDVYLYRDTLLPDDLAEGEAHRLARDGFVADVTPVSEDDSPAPSKPRTRQH